MFCLILLNLRPLAWKSAALWPSECQLCGHRFKSCHWLFSQKVPEFGANFYVFQVDHINTTDRFYFLTTGRVLLFIGSALLLFSVAQVARNLYPNPGTLPYFSCLLNFLRSISYPIGCSISALPDAFTKHGLYPQIALPIWCKSLLALL